MRAPPEYEEVEFTDEEALHAFVADRNERRNITIGQKAMAHAFQFPDAAKLRRLSSRSREDNVSKKTWQNLVSQARTVLAYSPELARQVRDGMPLNDAYETVKAEKQRWQ